MSIITTHVLDAALGRPAAGVPVGLDQWRQEPGQAGSWSALTSAVTDADGRVTEFGPAELPAGRYRVVFDTLSYFGTLDKPAFYPEVSVVFVLDDPASHYHIPLLLSPFAYSTYRGS